MRSLRGGLGNSRGTSYGSQKITARYEDDILGLATPAPIQVLAKPLPRSEPPLHATKTAHAVDDATNAMLQTAENTRTKT